AGLGDVEPGGVYLDQRHVGGGIDADDVRGDAIVIGELDEDLLGLLDRPAAGLGAFAAAGDDMGVGDDLTLLRDDEAGALAALGAAESVAAAGAEDREDRDHGGGVALVDRLGAEALRGLDDRLVGAPRGSRRLGRPRNRVGAGRVVSAAGEGDDRGAERRDEREAGELHFLAFALFFARGRRSVKA